MILLVDYLLSDCVDVVSCEPCTDPCVAFECGPGEQCKLDDWRRPSCVCRTLCAYDYNPVCANDGRTYSNECVMNADACKKRVRLRVVYTGECTTETGACHVTTITTPIYKLQHIQKPI